MASSTPLTVLLVEDDLVFQDVFRRVFTEMPGNWQIQAVGDGAAALQALAQSKQGFALALVDIGLPDMLGTQVIAAIRHRFAQLPILVTTTFQSERTFLEAVRAGAQGYLLKNETTISLRAAIEHVLQGQYPVSPALARHLFHLAGAAPHAGSPQKVLAPSALSDAVKLSARELELLNHPGQRPQLCRVRAVDACVFVDRAKPYSQHLPQAAGEESPSGFEQDPVYGE